MTGAEPFILACLAAPEDAAPRLILADWLQEHEWDDVRLTVLRHAHGWWEICDGKVEWIFGSQAVFDAFCGRGEIKADGAAYLHFGTVPTNGPKCDKCGECPPNLRYRSKRYYFPPGWRCGPCRVKHPDDGALWK